MERKPARSDRYSGMNIQHGLDQSVPLSTGPAAAAAAPIHVRSRAQDRPESKQILAKLAGKNQHLRKANISEVGSLCSVKFMRCNMYRKEKT
jgi:hypothetical protein